MGKLLEALSRRQQAVEELKRQPREPYEKDPSAGYQYYQKLLELDYLNRKAGNLLAEAFIGLRPEQRRSFYERTMSDEALENFGLRVFESELDQAEYDPKRSLREMFAKESNFGIPLTQLVAGMEQLMEPAELAKINRKLEANAPLAERAAAIYREMSSGQRGRTFELLPPEKRREYGYTSIENSVRNRTIGNILRNEKNYQQGQNRLSAIAELEQIVGDELTERVAAQIDALKPPSQSPNKQVRPREQEIDRLRSGILPGDPQAAEKQELLRRAEAILVYTEPEYLSYLNEMDKEKIAGERGLRNANDALAYGAVSGFLDGFQGGAFVDRLPKVYSNYTGMYNYGPTDVEPARMNRVKMQGIDLTEEELEQFRAAARGGLDPKVRDAVLSMVQDIDELGEKNYWIPDVVELVEGSWENPTKVMFKGEQGDKKYAFWPLVRAKNALNQAVIAGDWDKIRRSTAEYERCKTITDRLMQKSNEIAKEPTFPGNVNSTRPEGGNRLNPMPTEYLEDFAGHSRVNGVFVLYATSKNTGIPVKRFLDEPGVVLQEIAQDYIQKRLLSTQNGKPLGARLAFAFNNELQIKASTDWTKLQNPVSRGLDSVTGLMPDKEARQKYAGQSYCAMAAASYEVGKELVPWKNLSEGNAEKQRLAAQHAILLPEEEFDLKAVGLKLGHPDWKQTLAAAPLLQRLRQEGKLDPDAVVKRAKQLMADAAQAEKTMDSPANSVSILRAAAMDSFQQILDSASPAELETPPYRRLAEQSLRMRDEIRMNEVQNEQKALRTEIGKLSKEKSGWFLSSKNSPAYDKMMGKLKLLKRKMDWMSGKESAFNGIRTDVRETLDKKPLKEFLEEARRASFSYVNAKTKGGTSIILHEAGGARTASAMNALVEIGKIEDKLGLRTPAERLMNDVELAVIRGRGSAGWEKKNCMKCAAAAIVALSLQYRNVSPEKQQELMKPEKLGPALKQVMEQPAFKQMVKNEGLEGLGARLVGGTASLTDAYMKAVKQVEDPQAKVDASQRTMAEREEFWRKAESPVQLQP